jgi:hypothetical protein
MELVARPHQTAAWVLRGFSSQPLSTGSEAQIRQELNESSWGILLLRPTLSAPGRSFRLFSRHDCTERGRRVKPLRCAPTADAARTHRAGLTHLPYALLCLLRYGKKGRKKLGGQQAAAKPTATPKNARPGERRALLSGFASQNRIQRTQYECLPTCGELLNLFHAAHDLEAWFSRAVFFRFGVQQFIR